MSKFFDIQSAKDSCEALHQAGVRGPLYRLIFKICATPALNTTVLQTAGYRNIWDYFVGRSRYNKSIYGWGGHTKVVEGG